MPIQNIQYPDGLAFPTKENPFIVAGSKTVDGVETLVSADITTRQLLELILTELKKLNTNIEELI